MSLSLLVLLVVVVGLGILPAYAVARDLPVAIPLAGAVTLSAAGVGGTISAVLSAPLLAGVIPVLLAVNGAAWWWFRRDGVTPRRLVATTRGEGLDAVFVVVGLFAPALVSLAYRPIPPIGWDARSIYWFHAAWFQHGGGVVRAGIANPLFRYAHSDYPPGPPALIGSIWKVTGGEDLALARDLTFVLTALAIAGLAWLLMGRRRTPLSMVAGMLFVMGTPLLANRQAAEGYFDLLCALLVVIAVVAAREMPASTAPAVVAVSMMAASLTKGEGLAFGLVAALVLVVVAGRLRVRLALASGLAFVPVLAWLALVKSIDPAVRDVPPRQIIRAALLRAPERGRLKEAFPRVFEEVQPYLILAVVVIALVGGALLLERSRTSIVLPVMMVVIGVGLVGFLIVFYAAGPYPLDWWFETSLARVTTASKLLFLGAVVDVFLMASRRDRSPDSIVVG